MICPSCGMDEKYDKQYCSFCGKSLYLKKNLPEDEESISSDILLENRIVTENDEVNETDIDADNFDKKNANLFWTSAFTFVLLSAVDLICSWESIINGGMREANNYALRMLMKFGPKGFIYYKGLLVIIIITVLWIVAQYRPKTAFIVMLIANILMVCLSAYHILILTGYITPENGIVIR